MRSRLRLWAMITIKAMIVLSIFVLPFVIKDDRLSLKFFDNSYKAVSAYIQGFFFFNISDNGECDACATKI